MPYFEIKQLELTIIQVVESGDPTGFMSTYQRKRRRNGERRKKEMKRSLSLELRRGLDITLLTESVARGFAKGMRKIQKMQRGGG